MDRGIEGVSIDDFKLCLLLYAEDSIIISSNKEELQNSLDILHDYCKKWHHVNVEKTKIIIFRKGGRLSMNDFWFNGDFLIEVVDSFQYLGLILSYTGKFLCAQKDLASRGLRAMYALRNNVSQLVDLDVNMLLNLFDKMVTPVLSYGCEVWGFHTASAIERVHSKSCKLVLKVSKSTCNEMIYGELERYPLIIERKVKFLSYWLKIVHNESSFLVQKVYSIMYAAVTRNAMLENWASLVKKNYAV